VDGLTLVGRGSLAHRLWRQPAVNVLGIDAPPSEGSAAQLVPHARAKIGISLAPGQDVERAYELVCDHLMHSVDWGARFR
jgi:hypothetical protein